MQFCIWHENKKVSSENKYACMKLNMKNDHITIFGLQVLRVYNVYSAWYSKGWCKKMKLDFFSPFLTLENQGWVWIFPQQHSGPIFWVWDEVRIVKPQLLIIPNSEMSSMNKGNSITYFSLLEQLLCVKCICSPSLPIIVRMLLQSK